MYFQRRQLLFISMTALIVASLLTVSSLFTFIPTLAFLILFFITLSLISDGAALYIQFRQQEGIIQVIRGIILCCLLFIVFFHLILK